MSLRRSLFALLLWLVPSLLLAAQTVRVGIYHNSPKVAIAESGEAQGIFVDILEAIAREEGWAMEYLPGTWGEGLDRLAAGEIDLMPDVAYSTTREAQFDFHQEPVISSWFQLYTRRGSGIRSIPDLAGKRVMVLERSVQQAAFEQLAGSFGFQVTLLPVPDYRTMFAQVAAGEADAAITNRYYGLMHAAQYDLEDTAVVFHPTNLFYAAPEGKNGALLRAIDRHLVRMKGDPGSVYYQTLERWISEKVDFSLPDWVKVAALVAGIVLLLSLAGGALLKRQVNMRTLQLRQRNEEMAFFNRTLRATASSLELATVLEEATRGALELTGFDGGVFCLRDAEQGRLEVAARIGPCGEADCARDGGPLRDALCPGMVENLGGQPVLRHAATANTPLPCGNVHAEGVCWNAFFPLAVQGRTVGLLCLYSRRAEAPAQRLLDLVQELCVPVALALENSRLYEETRRHALELEQRVSERTHELSQITVALFKAKQAAESADRLKSAFLATMSHELRTPLNSIIGFTGLVLQEIPGPLNGEQKKQLGMVRDSARHLLALINDVLDISKIEAGELDVIAEPYDLAASITKVVGIVAPLAEKKGLTLTVEGVEGAGTLVGDARRVEQILLNLLGNAVKFTEQGGVTLSVERVNDYSEGGSAPPREVVVVGVTDTGIGIREEDMSQLFQPFRQIDSALSRQHEGTGLGLAICHRLAGLMGGCIEAESRWGEGSRFTLRLPRHGTTEEEVADGE
ncbi:MAG: transporter substrate-binding domain-containing protein [Gammaproteobacteria bacterium]|nr:transporter substrate-binding domain-containing protein [Gammaproteobacteria bacterium]